MAFARNNAVVQSATAGSGQVGQDATWVSIWDAATGGNRLKNIQITGDPDALIQDARFQIPVNGLVFRQNAGTGETEEFAQRGLRGRIDGGVWVQWHTGDPGANGTANIIALARTQVAESGFNITNT